MAAPSLSDLNLELDEACTVGTSRGGITASVASETEASPLGNPNALAGAVDELAVIDNVLCDRVGRTTSLTVGAAQTGVPRRRGGCRPWPEPVRDRDGVRVRVRDDGARTTIRSGGDRTTMSNRGNQRSSSRPANHRIKDVP
jgi:hypothetical protein